MTAPATLLVKGIEKKYNTEGGDLLSRVLVSEAVRRERSGANVLEGYKQTQWPLGLGISDYKLWPEDRQVRNRINRCKGDCNNESPALDRIERNPSAISDFIEAEQLEFLNVKIGIAGQVDILEHVRLVLICCRSGRF